MRSARCRSASTSSSASSVAVSSGTDLVSGRTRSRSAASIGVTGEVPDHGTQLEVGGEAQPVVDRPDVVAVEQAVPALAVGVVDQQVEHRDGAQLLVEVGVVLEHREVVLLVVGVDEPLERALAERAVTDHRRRNDPQPHRFGQAERRGLPPVEAGSEVPQRAFAAHGLVDRLLAAPVVGHPDEERRVAAPGHPADHLDLARDRGA